MSHAALEISPEIADALQRRQAVVALESTIIAHGLPSPDNLEVGRALESAVRAEGAIPATIAILGGRCKIGLSDGELQRVASEPKRFVKTGVNDLGPLCARSGDGATTVSATALLAARAGIRLFATGGIGGVHRQVGAGEWDVSSDLVTLAREPIAVVSAGAKAILDLPRTLEMLETLAVPVIGFQTHDFPAFYTRSSGLKLEHQVATAAEAAALLRHHFSFRQTGVLFANPIPESDALDAREIESAIGEALSAARGVTGKALTPFLLSHLARATGQRSLAANRALALNNARVAAQIARAL